MGGLDIAPLSSYDPDVCYMQWIDGNYLWFQPASYCTTSSNSSTSECTWNFGQGLNIQHNWVLSAMPADSLIKTYTCDNQPHQLGFADPSGDPPIEQNRYVCTCGQPIASEYVTTYNATTNATSSCKDRCDRPWAPAFNTFCNYVTETSSEKIAKGNYSAGDVSEGVCFAAAVQGPANNSVGPYPEVSVNQYSIVDGIGIGTPCNIQYPDNVRSGVCMCDSALPEYAWGRKITNRDPCGIERKTNKDWIAAPVIGGVALLVGVILSILFLQRRKRRGLQRQDISDEIALTNLRSCITQSLAVNDGQERNTLSQRSAAGLDFSTPSQSSIQSADSGVSLINPQARRDLKG